MSKKPALLVKQKSSKIKKKQKCDDLEFKEPFRKSVFDLLKENLTSCQRKNFLMRIYLTGEHNFDESSSIQTYFTSIVRNINNTTNDETITGTLFYYKTLFCCVIEGSEDTVFELIKKSFLDNEVNTFKNLKILKEEFHLFQRLAEDWFSQTNAEKQTVSEHSTGSFETVMSLIETGVSKMNDLTKTFNKIFMETLSDASEENEEAVGLIMESGFLDYYEFKLLFESDYLKNINQFAQLYFNPHSMFIDENDENVWPCPEEPIRYQIFDSYVEPISALPI